LIIAIIALVISLLLFDSGSYPLGIVIFLLIFLVFILEISIECVNQVPNLATIFNIYTFLSTLFGKDNLLAV